MIANILESLNIDRLEQLKLARNYYLNFLDRSIRYDLIPKTSPEYLELSRYFLEDKEEDDVREERFEKWLKIVPRDMKIDRMKRIMKLKSIEIPECKEESDDEIDCLVWTEILNCHVLICLDRFGILIKEMELLEMGQDHVVDMSEEDRVSSNPSNMTTRIDKPFKLVKDRKNVAEGVFKYGHNLPTMTIEEYLELERRRGNIISGGGAASTVKLEIDEDDEETTEIELKKAREFDELKDCKLF